MSMAGKRKRRKMCKTPLVPRPVRRVKPGLAELQLEAGVLPHLSQHI
jgi:hypothetical protein